MSGAGVKREDDGFVRVPYSGLCTFGKAPYQPDWEKIDARVAVLGVPFDEGTSNRPGTRYGPRHIREASDIYAYLRGGFRGWYDCEADREILPDGSLVDIGDVKVTPTEPQTTFALTTQAVETVLAQGAFPVILGGDHSITFPCLRAFAGRPVDVVHLDSHTDFLDDMGGARYAHGSPLKRSSELEHVGRVVQVGIRGLNNGHAMMENARAYSCTIITAREVLEDGIDRAVERIPPLGDIYLTLDIDVLDPSVAPGTGTPEFGGLDYPQVRRLIEALPGRGRLVGMDLVEVNGLYDPTGRTAQVAARLIIDVLGAAFPEPRVSK